MRNVYEIARERAHELWERVARPEGCRLEFWFAARRELEGETAAGALGHHIVGSGVLDEAVEELAAPQAPRSLAD